MNRENYDKKVLTTFNIIGCYFTNLYYNFLHRRAKRLHEKYGRSSLTDEYKKVIRVYAEDITSRETLYKEMVLELHKYYQSTTHKTCYLDDFTNRVLEHFLPEEHLGIMTDAERNFFLSKILSNIIADFTMYVSGIDALRGVIDDHINRANTRQWLNQIIDIQMLLREKLYRDFVRKGRPQTVDLETFHKMQDDRDKLMGKLKEVVAELVTVKDQLANAKKIAEHMANENQKLLAGMPPPVPVARRGRPPRPRGSPPVEPPSQPDPPADTRPPVSKLIPPGARRRVSGERVNTDAKSEQSSSSEHDREIKSNPFTDDIDTDS